MRSGNLTSGGASEWVVVRKNTWVHVDGTFATGEAHVEFKDANGNAKILQSLSANGEVDKYFPQPTEIRVRMSVAVGANIYYQIQSDH